jgi:hypothetical protein
VHPWCRGPVELEYKYVVCGGDGEGAAWKPGGNFVLSMPTGRSGSVKIRDAWDESSREVQVSSSRGDCSGRAAALAAVCGRAAIPGALTLARVPCRSRWCKMGRAQRRAEDQGLVHVFNL